MEAGLLLFVGAVLILFTFRGWWRGFLRTALGMLAVVLALVLVVVLSPTVTRLLRTETPLYSAIYSTVSEVMAESLDLTAEKTLEEQEQALENSSLPSVLKETLLENNREGMYELLGAGSFLEYISGYLTGVILNICGILLTFLLSFVVIRLAFLLLGTIGNLPGIHILNQLGGGILGFGQGLVVLWLCCFLVTVLSGTSWGQEALRAIEGNAVLSAIYDGALSLGSVLELGRSLF